MKEVSEIFKYWMWYVKPSSPLLPITKKLFWLGINGIINPLTLEPKE